VHTLYYPSLVSTFMFSKTQKLKMKNGFMLKWKTVLCSVRPRNLKWKMNNSIGILIRARNLAWEVNGNKEFTEAHLKQQWQPVWFSVVWPSLLIRMEYLYNWRQTTIDLLTWIQRLASMHCCDMNLSNWAIVNNCGFHMKGNPDLMPSIMRLVT